MKDKILVVCPNPSIDVTLELADFIHGGLNRTKSSVTNYSGKGINVAKGIKRLGGDVILTGFMFKAGSEGFITELNALGIPHDFVFVDGEVRTNYKFVENDGTLTEVNTSGKSVDESQCNALIDKIKAMSKFATITVISGSLPAKCGNRFYGEMTKAASGTTVMCDTEDEKLLFALENGAGFIKPNLHELEQLTGKKLKITDEIITAAEILIKNNTTIVLISLGCDGAIITNGVERYHAAAPKVTVQSSVGAGDSMLSASALSLAQNRDLKSVLTSAVAAGSASVMTEGTNLFNIIDYEYLRNKIKIYKI